MSFSIATLEAQPNNVNPYPLPLPALLSKLEIGRHSYQLDRIQGRIASARRHQNLVEAPFEVFMGDGAFDGETVSNAVLVKQPAAQAVVPPHKTAVYSEAGDTQRDEHIRATANMAAVLA
jgi:hypothetical protein